MGENLGGDGRDDGVARYISSQDSKVDCGNYIKEGRRRLMGVSLSRRYIGDHRDLSNKVVCDEATGNNCVVCSRDTHTQTFYKRIVDGRFQYVPQVVTPRTWPQTYIEVGRVKRKQCQVGENK